MTTAHRPTFDPARGKEAARGVAYHQRLLPAHTLLKHRQPGQGGAADANKRDLRAELLEAEARHFAKKNGTYVPDDEPAVEGKATAKRPIDAVSHNEDDEVDGEEQKRRRIELLEKYRDIDADDSSGSSDSSDDEYVTLRKSYLHVIADLEE
jgi:protein CWC15